MKRIKIPKTQQNEVDSERVCVKKEAWEQESGVEQRAEKNDRPTDSQTCRKSRDRCLSD